jgi:hypothetical protein
VELYQLTIKNHMLKLKNLIKISMLVSLAYYPAAYAQDIDVNSDTESSILPETGVALLKPDEVEKIIAEYKAYLDALPLEVKKEITDYRLELANINKQKRDLYKKLSDAGKEFLKMERQYKKRLPAGKSL